VAWKGVSAVVLQLSRLATALILARLLSPHDYGVAGMVLVVSGLVLIFSDLAFGAALVQRKVLTETDRSTVFWTNAFFGLVFTCGAFFASGPVAQFYGQPAVKPLFQAFSVAFLVTSLSSTQSALLSREMNFRSLELRQMISYAAGAVVGIVAAMRGAGAWAIILQQLSIAFVSTALLTAFSSWRPKLSFSLESLRSMGAFSGRVFATRILFYFNRNVDNLLVGRFLGSAALGAYSLAYNVMLMPFSRISSPVQDVMFPAFSRVQDDPGRIGAGWLRVNRLVAAITVPSLVGLVLVAPDFIRAVLGEKWSAAIPVVRILCWVGLLQSLQGLNSSILEARDRTQDLVRYAVIVAVASVIAFVIGLEWGIVGVAAGYAVSSTVVEPYYTWVTARSIGLPLRDVIANFRGVFEASVAMAAAVIGVQLLLVAGAPAERHTLCIVAGAAVYLPACAWRDRALVEDLRSLGALRSKRVLASQVDPA